MFRKPYKSRRLPSVLNSVKLPYIGSKPIAICVWIGEGLTDSAFHANISASYQDAVKLITLTAFLILIPPHFNLRPPDRVSRGAGDYCCCLQRKFPMIDLDRARLEPTRTVAVVLPRSLADAIEQRAKAELLAKSSWMRRVLLTELNKDAGEASAPESA
ncbi:hypothetical protein [Bradyrhizobium lupini]